MNSPLPKYLLHFTIIYACEVILIYCMCMVGILESCVLLYISSHLCI